MFNYIKAHRKNWGLTQRELGFLLGQDSNGRISELEKGKKKPNLTETIVFELLFEKASSRLFPDIYHEITNTLNKRLKTLEEHFSEINQTQQTERILKRLHDIRQNLIAINNQRI